MLVKVKRSITPEYDGWVVVYPKIIDNVITYLWRHGLCHNSISKITNLFIQRARRNGQYTYCEILDVEEF